VVEFVAVLVVACSGSLRFKSGLGDQLSREFVWFPSAYSGTCCHSTSTEVTAASLQIVAKSLTCVKLMKDSNELLFRAL
jgi:hypothetical protein